MGIPLKQVRLDDAGSTVRLSAENELILDLIPAGSRVMDLGCGEGDLLKALAVKKQARAEGIELSEECIQACVAKGIFNVHQGNLDEGLADYPDQSIDYVMLTNTLQVLHNPQWLLLEMARVGKQCLVSFPNFAHWRVRWQLAFHGRMPKTLRLPFEWYDSANIHLTTLKDFRRFCDAAALRIVSEIPLRTDSDGSSRRVRVLPNLFADAAIFIFKQAA
jgi:methionine biosynthesis protein MetW